MVQLTTQERTEPDIHSKKSSNSGLKQCKCCHNQPFHSGGMQIALHTLYIVYCPMWLLGFASEIDLVETCKENMLHAIAEQCDTEYCCLKGKEMVLLCMFV